MSHLQIKLSDEALQAVKAAGADGPRLVERFIKDDIDEFEKWFTGRMPEPINDRLAKFEKAICMTYAKYVLGRVTPSQGNDHHYDEKAALI